MESVMNSDVMMSSSLGQDVGGQVTDWLTPTEPPDPTHRDVETFNFIINVVFVGLFCVFGYVGNVLILIVLHKLKIGTSNAIFLQAMAVFDAMFLTYAFFYVVLRTLASYTGALPGYTAINSYIVAIVLPIGWTAQTCTIWLVMVIAIDRYIVVSRPLKSTIWCTTTNARIAVVVVFISAVLFNLPRWPHYYNAGFMSRNESSTFVSHLNFDATFWDEELYSKVYHISFTFIFLFLIPLSVLIVLNVRLIATIRSSSKARQKMTNNFRSKKSRDSNRAITLLVVVIVTIFMISQFPDFIAAIIGACSNARGNLTGYKYFAPVKESLLVLNSSINCVIYFLFYHRFRRTLTGMVYRMVGQKYIVYSDTSRKGDNSSSHSTNERFA